MTTTSWKLPALIILGILLMQAAWSLAVPPFRGVDEFDHAYRASEVAQGEWLPPPVAPEHGRGFVVAADADLVAAARTECEARDYTGRDNCNPIDINADGTVTVASGASRYNPAFYLLTGTLALPFHGTGGLYAMRTGAGLMTAAFFLLAAWTTRLWSRTIWPLVAVLVCMTPVVLYSASVMAPNGVEMSAALATWTALIGLTRPLSRRDERILLWSLLPSVVVLAIVRGMGPLWLLLAVLVVAALAGRKHVVAVFKRNPLPSAAAAGAGVIASVAGAGWTLAASSVSPEESPVRYSDPLLNSLAKIPLWFFQGIAAFPTRTEQAPTIVYAADGLVLLALLILGIVFATGRLRGVIVTSFLVAILVPFTVTLVTFAGSGPFWQGRYGLPFVFGFLLLSGLAVELRDPHHRLIQPALLSAWLAFSAAHVVSVVHVLMQERRSSPSAGTDLWLTPSPVFVGAITVASCLCFGYALHVAQRTTANQVVPIEATREASVVGC